MRIQIRDDAQDLDWDWVKGVFLESIRNNEKIGSLRRDNGS